VKTRTWYGQNIIPFLIPAQVQKQAEALAGALSAMQIKNVGDLVVHLPEL